MPVWAISLIITVLQKSGLVGYAERMAIKYGWEVIEDVSGLKTFHAPEDFPHGKNGGTSE